MRGLSSYRTHWLSAFIAGVLLCSGTIWAQENNGTGSNALKAAFLFNFTKFIQWPGDKFPSEATPLRVGFFGSGPVRDLFEEANLERTVGTRRIITGTVASGADVRNCHILFVCPQDGENLSSLLTEARRHHVLSVGHSTGFINQGGMVNFVDSTNGVRFQVNAKAARRAGIKMSSRLLVVAQVVDEDGNIVTPDPKLFR